MSDGVKLGQLLCDADIITKRQLSKALQAQVKGNKGTIGAVSYTHLTLPTTPYV